MICVKELVKNFDDVCAVNNITLNIPRREMLGLLGTNGAGKTTLLRMIAGVLEPMAAALSLTVQISHPETYLKRFFICRMILIFFRTPLWKK